MSGSGGLRSIKHFVKHREFFSSNLLSIDSRLNVPGGFKYRNIHAASQMSNNNRADEKKSTVGECLENWTLTFRKEEIPEPDGSIRNILAHVLKVKELSDVDRQSNMLLTHQEMQKVDDLCKKRVQRMPVQYIIGEWRFRDLNLKMRPPVFIPWPETEMLVDIVGQEIRLKGVRKVLELCCGSGAISLALLNEFPDLTITALDRSREACDLTLENARKLGLDKRLSVHQYEMTGDDRLDFVKGNVDLIVSNPPYMLLGEMADFLPESKLYEDQRALNGGPDGLIVMKHILKLTPRLLPDGGKLFLEVNPLHAARLVELFDRNIYLNLCYLKTHKDFAGKERYAEIIKAA